MKQLVIIADDLTGASDTGVQFVKKGYRSLVITHPTVFPPYLDNVSGENCILSINTDTRHLSADCAYQAVSRIVGAIKNPEAYHVYKKIDSTMRGHPGAELQALMDQNKYSLTLVAPAFPNIKRIVADGNLLIGGNSGGMDLDYPKDYEKICNICEAIQKEMTSVVGHIDQHVVEEGAGALLQAIEEKRKATPVIVIDAVSNHNLETIARTIKEIDGDVLVAGSAGLAEFLHLTWDLKNYSQLRNQSNILVIAGSKNPVTAKQVTLLASSFQAEKVLLDIENMIKNNREAEAARLLTSVRKQREIGGNLSIISIDPSYTIKQNKQETQKDIVLTLAKVAREMIITANIQGMIMTGGETAQNLCNEIGALGIELEAEISHGIPFGFLRGGVADGMPVVTKSGGFGDPDSLVQVVHYLNRLIKGVA